MVGRPLFAASLAFTGGVALGAWLPQEPAAWTWAVGAALVLWAALLAAGRLAMGARVGLATFVALGVLRIQGDLSPLYADAGGLEEGDAVASGRVARPPEPRDEEVLIHLEDVRLRRAGETARLCLPLQVVVAGPGVACAVGDRVTVRGRLRTIRGDRNLGWFPGPLLPRGRRCAARLVVDAAVWLRRDGQDAGRGPNAAVLRWRAAADAFWRRRPGPAAAILNSLTTGERAGMPEQVQEAFQRSGLTHLLAISGMNVAFLAALVFILLRRALGLWEALALRFPVQPVAAALTLPALWFFMLFSGSQIPVTRAVLSGAAGLGAVILWRRVDPGDAAALAGLAILAVDPRALFSPSFQLSFAAVGALLLVASRLSNPHPSPPDDHRVPRRLLRAVRSLVVVSLAASAATAPLVAFHFQQVSIVGPVANLAAVPLTGFVVLPAGWLALAATVVWEPAGDLMAGLAVESADWLAWVAALFAAPPWAVISTARPPPLVTLGLLALVAALLPRSTEMRRWAACGLCAATALAGTWWAIAAHASALTAVVLDVGQGAATALLLPRGGSLLCDAGPRWRDYDAGERIVVPALRRLGLTRVDTLVISHRHPDHAGGTDAVRRSFDVGKVWTGDGGGAIAAGREFALPGGVRIRALGPPRALGRSSPAAEVNDRSLALLVRIGDTGLVLPGDIGPSSAGAVALAAEPVPTRLVLVAPHHGGSPEACRILAAALRPEASVISVGRNTYGHPRAAAVSALEIHGPVLRTDRDGAVFVRGDGRSLSVRSWREMARGRTWPERIRWLATGW